MTADPDCLIVSVAGGYGGAERSIEIILQALAGEVHESCSDTPRPLVLVHHPEHRRQLTKPGAMPRQGQLMSLPARPHWPWRMIAARRLARLATRYPSAPLLLNTEAAARIAAMAAAEVPGLGDRCLIYVRDFQWQSLAPVTASLPGAGFLVPGEAVIRRVDYLHPYLKGYGGDRSFQIIPDPVSAIAPPGALKTAPTFLHLATVNGFKGHMDLVAALAATSAGGFRICSFGHVADPAIAARIDSAIRHEGLSDRFELAGYADPLAPLIRHARGVVVASVSHTDGPETFGRAVIEAWAQGRPVVAYACGGVVDRVSHGVDGLLVREGDIEGLGRAMQRLADDPALADRLGAAGREKAARSYPARAIASRLRGALLERRPVAGNA